MGIMGVMRVINSHIWFYYGVINLINPIINRNMKKFEPI